MNIVVRAAAAAALASLLLTGSAFAQATAPAAKSDTTAAPATKKAEVPHTAVSLECSKQADAQGLKGKARKKFRSACKKNGGKAN